MQNIISAMKKSILMRNFTEEDVKKNISSITYTLRSYSKGEIIAVEDDPCTSIGIVIKGCADVQRLYESGKSITMDNLNEGDIFGEVIIFSSSNTYPATIVSSTKSDIVFISRENVLKLCSLNQTFLNNFMKLLSNKVLMLNKRLKIMSYQSIRQKISSYLLDEYKQQKSYYIKLNCTKKEMAERLGIPRPSLSRELILMREDNLIDFDKNIIKLLDIEGVEASLYEN